MEDPVPRLGGNAPSAGSVLRDERRDGDKREEEHRHGAAIMAIPPV